MIQRTKKVEVVRTVVSHIKDHLFTVLTEEWQTQDQICHQIPKYTKYEVGLVLGMLEIADMIRTEYPYEVITTQPFIQRYKKKNLREVEWF